MCVFSHAFFGAFHLIVSTGDKVNVTIISWIISCTVCCRLSLRIRLYFAFHRCAILLLVSISFRLVRIHKYIFNIIILYFIIVHFHSGQSSL